MTHDSIHKAGAEAFLHSGEPGTDGREVFEDFAATGSGQAYANPAGTGATGPQPGGTPVVAAGTGAGVGGLDQHSHQGQGGISGSGAGVGSGLTSGETLGHSHSHSHSHSLEGERQNVGDNELTGSHSHRGLEAGGVGAAGLAGAEASRELKHDNQGANAGNTGAYAPPSGAPPQGNTGAPTGAGASAETTRSADGHRLNDSTQHRWATHEEAVNAGYEGHEGHPNAGNAPHGADGEPIIPAGTGVGASAPGTTGSGVDTSAIGSGREAEKAAGTHGSSTASKAESKLEQHAEGTEEHHKKGLLAKVKELL